MRRLLVLLLGAALLPVPVAVADPLAPRGADRVRVWLVERVGSPARVMDFPVRFRLHNERSMLFFAAFERSARGRDFFDAQFTGVVMNQDGGAYPRVYADGHGPLLPACPAQALCTDADSDDTTYELPVTQGRFATRRSLYLVAVNTTVESIGVRAGWRVRELPANHGAAVHMVRDSTGVDTNAVAAVDTFKDAAQRVTTGPSIAFGVIPCPWGPDGPTGPGAAVLSGGGPLTRAIGSYDDRRPTCGRLEIGRAANPRPTSWRLAGEATGFLVAPFHLVVLELPERE